MTRAAHKRATLPTGSGTWTTPGVALTGVRRLEHVDIPVANPGPGEARVRVLAVGLCGSDAHWFLEGGIGDASLGAGLVLGHEIVGSIESGPRTGERVVIDPAIPCLECGPCRDGHHNLCLEVRFAGHGAHHGGLRGRLAWPERCLARLPDHLPTEQGALLEPLGVALHAIDLAMPSAPARIAIIGCGPIGLLLLIAAKAAGIAQVYADDPIAHRLEAAVQRGGVPLPANDLSGDIDVVFDCAGTEAALHTALTLVRPAGRIVMVGIPEGNRTSFAASLARRKEVTMSMSRRMLPSDLERAVSLATSGAVDLGGLVTHRFPLSRAADAFDTLIARSGIKVIVEP